MTKEIPLTQGKVALVDDEDYEYLNQWKWQTKKGYNTYYAQGRINSKSILMHRIILNAHKEEIVDHINHDGLDNRKENLRICTSQENCRNQKCKSIVSGYKGVTLNPRMHQWESCIRVNEKRLYLGLFDDVIEAAYAHDEAAIYHYKEFAYLNFPNLTSKDRNCSANTIRRIQGLPVSISRTGKRSRFFGVTHYKCKNNKWMCRITIDSKRLYLGVFTSEIEAALVYDQKATELHGDSAHLNFPAYI